MLGYYVQPSRLGGKTSQHIHYDEVKSTTENNTLDNFQEEHALKHPKQALVKQIIKNANQAYLIPTRMKGVGRCILPNKGIKQTMPK